MIINTIAYGASFETRNEEGLHHWSKPRLGGTLEEGDNPVQCLHILRDKINESEKDNYSIKLESSYWVDGIEKKLINDELPIDTMIEDMQMCKSIEELITFEKLPKDKVQQTIYDLQLLKLKK